MSEAYIASDSLPLFKQVLEGRDLFDVVESEGAHRSSRKTKIVFNEVKRLEIIDLLSEELAKIGFDANYELTKEGRYIENLLQAFQK